MAWLTEKKLNDIKEVSISLGNACSDLYAVGEMDREACILAAWLELLHQRLEVALASARKPPTEIV